MYRGDCVEYEATNDLADLEQVTLDNVLDCLITRFKLGHYYTFAGSVLVSLNPCLKSRNSILNDPVGTSVCEDKKLPHVYSVGRQCVAGLEKTGRHQVVIVSGESGAGKTTATQQLLRYFIENRQESSSSINGLERKIYYASQILEAFGNASTTANPNSSRFGRLIQIHYDINGGIRGASIETCLMEKHRVSKWAKEERNFHVFYYVLEALKKDTMPIGLLKDAKDLPADLIPSEFLDAVRPSDTDELSSFLHAIQALEMDQEMIDTFRIIVGLMILLNLKFVSTSDDKENSESEDSLKFCMKKRLFRVQCTAICKTLIENIFKVEFEDLEDALVARNFSAGRRKSCIRKPCETLAECKERLSAIVLSIYDALFGFILNQLNQKLRNSSNSNAPSISLLDLYGFECLKLNHLEQLCINYANERLQQVYVSNLKKHRDDMGDGDLEGGCNKEFDRIEADVCLRLCKMEGSLFASLDEACVLNRRQTNEAELFARLSDSLKDSNMFRVSKKRGDHQFSIRHYAGEVNYNFDGMVEKNRDYVPPELMDLLRNKSEDKMLQSMLQCSHEASATPLARAGAKSKREKTILQRFKVSVETLMSRLSSKHATEDRDIHFIRCIRPNHDLQRGKVVRELVEKQLYSCGIVDAVRITANGFPIRVSADRLRDKFPAALRCHPNGLNHTRVLDEGLKAGKSLLLMTESAWSFLSHLNGFILSRNSTKIQRRWRQVQKNRKEEAERQIQMLIAPIPVQVHSRRSSIISGMGDSSLTFIETTFLRRLSLFGAIQGTQTHAEKLPDDPSAIFRSLITRAAKDIFSRRFVFEDPVRVYVRRTVLAGNHIPPRKFLPKGLPDVIDTSDCFDVASEAQPDLLCQPDLPVVPQPIKPRVSSRCIII